VSKGASIVMQLLQENPWLLVIFLGVLVPLTAIVFGTVTHYLRRVHEADLEANLKHEMLQRGMSAEDIRIVIEATPRGRKRHSCDPSWANELRRS
jgi:hypothetical protein